MFPIFFRVSRLKIGVMTACLVFSVLLGFSSTPTPRVVAASAPHLVKNINPNGPSNPKYLTPFNGKLAFIVAKTADGKHQLWQSNGTRRGTRELKSFVHISPPIVAGNNLLFMADDGVHGSGVWRSDGTAQGTRLLAALTLTKNGTAPHFLGSAGNLAYFVAQPSLDDVDLYRTDGTTAGTTLIAYMNGTTGLGIGSEFYFSGVEPISANYELWKTDGTGAGTRLVKEINSNGGSFPSDFTPDANGFTFFATDGTGQRGLWHSDGTTNGTQLVREISAADSSEIAATATLGGKLYFVNVNHTADAKELWVSNSTPAGTKLLKNLAPLDFGTGIAELAVAGSRLIIATGDGDGHGNQLYASDGTPDGTTMLTTFLKPFDAVLGPLVAINNLVYFASVGPIPADLWTTDGTVQGTQPLGGANAQPYSSPKWLTNVNNTLYFIATDTKHSRELWSYQP